MIALKGIYHKGKLTLDEAVDSDKPLKVIVTFLEEEAEMKQKKREFSFKKSRKLLADYKGSFSDAVIEERNQE